MCGRNKRNNPYHLSKAPKFKFADDFKETNKLQPYNGKMKCKLEVEFDENKMRFYDEGDFNIKSKKHVMTKDFIGDFAFPQ